MKFARPLLSTLGIIVAVGAAGIALALIPAIQRWALLQFLAAPGLRVEVAAVSAGFSDVELRGLKLERNGLKVQLERLKSDYSLWQLLVRRRLSIRAITVNGLLVDASRLSRVRTEAALAGAPVAAPGLLAQLQLPFELVLEEFRLEGHARLPAASGSPPIEAEYQITGGKFAPGREGTLLLQATLKNPSAEDRVAALHTQLFLHATSTEEGTFSQVGLTAVVDAEGKIFAEQNQLKITADFRKDVQGEDYSVSIDTLQHGTAENVLAVHAALPAGRPEFTGDWTLKVRTAQVGPFFLGGELPDFNVRGAGRFAFSPTAGGASLQGSLQAEASQLEAIEPGLRAIGAVSVQARFDVAETMGIARLNQLDIRIGGEQPVLDLQAARAVEINLKERRLQVGGSTPGEALNLTFHGLPLAWVRPFITAVDVSGGLITGQVALTGEADRILLKVVQPLRIDQLTVVQRGELRLSRAEISLDLNAVLTRQELQANITELTLKTPAGDVANVLASISLPTGPDPAISVLARYTADLPSLLGSWFPLGHVRTVGEADLTLTGGKVDLRRFSANVTDATGLALFNATTARSFTFDTATGQVAAVAGGPTELLRVVLGRLPLGVFAPAQLVAGLDGWVERGEFVLSTEGDKLTLRASAPFQLAGLSLTQGGQPALTGLSLRAQPVIEFTAGGGTKIQTGEVNVFTATGATLLTVRGDAGKSAATGRRSSLTFALEVPALASQPLFAGASAVSAGRATGEIRLALGPTSQVEARLTLNGLVAADGRRTLPVANLSFRAVVQADGRASVQAPLLLDRAGTRSDLNFSLELIPNGRGFRVDGKLGGSHVELEDALILLGVFASSANQGDRPSTPAATAPEAVADTVPVWSRFGGQLTLDIKSVTHGSQWAMTDLSGQVTLEPARIALQKLAASFGEKSRLTAQGGMDFTGGARPYAMAGDFSLTEFDAGKFFKALEPDKPPTVEGVFTVAGHFSGTGETVGRTAEHTHGKFELTSPQGVFRGLQRTSTKLSMASKAVELGASVLGSIFGTAAVTKAAEKVAGQAYFLDQLAQSIGELNYDRLSVRLSRDDSLDVKLDDISLVSSEIRLIGGGTVTYQPGVPLLAQPLNASLLFGARGKVEQLLGKLRVLDGTQDELGYARTREPVILGGTLAKPDPSAFFNKVAAAKLTELLEPGN